MPEFQNQPALAPEETFPFAMPHICLPEPPPTIHKLARLAIGAALVSVFTLTGCPEGGFFDELAATLGKDDFKGTWVADYTLPATESASGAVDYVTISMVFNGKSENLGSGNKGYFCQSKVAYANKEKKDDLKDATADEDSTETHSATIGEGTPRLVNFYWGTYSLSDNSNYTAGKNTLTYMGGFSLTKENPETAYIEIDGKKYTLQDLMEITFETGTKASGDTEATGIYKVNDEGSLKGKAFFDNYYEDINWTAVYYAPSGSNVNYGESNVAISDEQAELRADMETFTFSLSDAGSTSYKALNMHEWYWVDQIAFTTSDNGKNWTYASTSPYGGSLSDGKVTGRTGKNSGRYVTWYVPNGKLNRGSAKHKVIELQSGSGTKLAKITKEVKGADGSISYEYDENIDITDGTWDKDYASAGMSSWDKGDRAFARITNKNSMTWAMQFVNGTRANADGTYIDFVENTVKEDAYDADDTEDRSVEPRSAGAVEAVYADEALINLVGDYSAEK